MPAFGEKPVVKYPDMGSTWWRLSGPINFLGLKKIKHPCNNLKVLVGLVASNWLVCVQLLSRCRCSKKEPMLVRTNQIIACQFSIWSSLSKSPAVVFLCHTKCWTIQSACLSNIERIQHCPSCITLFSTIAPLWACTILQVLPAAKNKIKATFILNGWEHVLGVICEIAIMPKLSVVKNSWESIRAPLIVIRVVQVHVAR